MRAELNIWRDWARTLRQWGLGELAAVILESAGPLTLLGAQAVYLAQPVFSLLFPDEHLAALAAMLEDATQSRAFAVFLREETQS